MTTRVLTSAEKKALEDRLSRVISKAAGLAAAKASTLSPGIKYGDSLNFVLVESAITKSELCQLLGGIIEKLCEKLGVELRIYENSYELPDDPEIDQFLCGLFMSLENDNIKDYLPSLRIDKKPYDLGKTVGFLLRVRGEVIHGAYTNVSLQGLKTCHRYFGNDSTRPTSEKERSERRSPLEIYLMRMFAKVTGNADKYKPYFDLLVTLFQKLKLQGLDDECVHRIIDHYQKSFEDVRINFEKPILSIKKGSKSKVQTGTRRPKRPNSSPTLLNVEFKDFIDPLINAHWNSLEHHKRDFKENVRTYGFYPTCKNIHEVYESRFEVTRNFSNLTTKRLQEARSYGLLSNSSKKTDFTDEIRSQFFEKRSINHRVNLFVDELKKLIPEKFRTEAIRKLCNGMAGVDEMSPNQLILLLSDKVAMAYPRANIDIGNFNFANQKVDKSREKLVRTILEKLSTIVELKKQIQGRIKSFIRSVYTRKQFVAQTTNYSLLKNEIAQAEILLGEDFWTNSVTIDVWKAYYVSLTNIKDPNYFRKEMVESLHAVSREIKQLLDSRDQKLFPLAIDANDGPVNEIIDLLSNLKI